MSPSRLDDRAAALRLAFDRAFAAPLAGEPPRREGYLGIRVGGEPYALRLADVAGVFSASALAPLPAAVEGFVGVASLRGALVAVYDLRAFLGYPVASPAPWLAIVRSEPSLALAFDGLEATQQVEAGQVLRRDGAAAVPHVGEVVPSASGARPVVEVASVVEAIRVRVRRPSRPEEESAR